MRAERVEAAAWERESIDLHVENVFAGAELPHGRSALPLVAVKPCSPRGEMRREETR